MGKIIDYCVLEIAEKQDRKEEDGAVEIAKLVNNKIKEGWEPLGGLSVCPLSVETESQYWEIIYSQAMVKREAEAL